MGLSFGMSLFLCASHHLTWVQAEHPTEKSFRPSHRAALHGSILHDASYTALIELKGKQALLRRVLNGCSDPHGVSPGAAMCVQIKRSLQTLTKVQLHCRWPRLLHKPLRGYSVSSRLHCSRTNFLEAGFQHPISNTCGEPGHQ